MRGTMIQTPTGDLLAVETLRPSMQVITLVGWREERPRGPVKCWSAIGASI